MELAAKLQIKPGQRVTILPGRADVPAALLDGLPAGLTVANTADGASSDAAGSGGASSDAASSNAAGSGGASAGDARSWGDVDVLIAFVVRRADLSSAELARAVAAARADRLTWIAYPKAGQLGTDLNRDLLRDALAAEAVQPVRQVALDAVWSALRLRPA